ncbi:MAG: class I SAM-dependent methyltransferase [Deltaproteobacteria bacterium]|nr:class I SAM-dependent methyltransferase [Deltaproteobacteria bacterium]
MSPECHQDQTSKNLPIGSRHYRAFVGPAEKYDLVSAMQFNLLTSLGLREHHFLLDIGCGSLRAGRLFIPYLSPGRYWGLEPEQWLIEDGIKNELGEDIIRIKQPVFSYDNNFTLSIFNREFDFILAQSIFSHAPEPQIKKCLSEAKKVMSPTSIFAATFVEGNQNYTGNEWVYPGCVTYTLEYMKNLVEDRSLTCKPIDWPHPNGQTWMVIVHPENEYNIPDLSVNRLSPVGSETGLHENRLPRMERHPYVRLGLTINRFTQRIKQWRR